MTTMRTTIVVDIEVPDDLDDVDVHDGVLAAFEGDVGDYLGDHLRSDPDLSRSVEVKTIHEVTVEEVD